jgi:hypothetical protein
MPCSGCTSATASTLALLAITPQRTAPAIAAAAIAPPGVNRATSVGPSTKNTSTSASTASDQSTLEVAAPMPAWAPADDGEGVVHRMAAEHQRSGQDQPAEHRKAKKRAHARARRAV